MNPLDLAARGWFIFPVRDRRPLTRHGYKDGSTDPEQIKAWADHWPGCSWGIDLGRSGLVVLDVDVKKGKPGMAELEKLLPELPETYTAETPSGGLHLYYTRPEGWEPRRVIGWRPGLDLLSDGVLFAYPGDEVRLAEAPPLFTSVAERPATPARPATPQALRAAERFLEEHGPAIVGEGGNGHTVQAITKLCWDFALSPEEAWPLLSAWNETCEPPWTEKELAYKIEHLHEGDSPRGLARAALELRRKKTRAPAAGRLVDFVPILRARSKTPWVSTPWKGLDEALGGGLPVGTVTLVAAGTGKGKTSFAAQMGAHHAQSAPVVYYMGELSGDMLAARVVAQRRRASWADVLRGQVPDAEMSRILEPLDFRVVERCEEPAEAMEAALDAARDADGAPMLVVDYVQLLADWADPSGVRQSVTLAIRWLLKLTAERKLVTVVISQTSRLTASMLRADGDVRAEDFVGAGAESSALEQDADNVLALRVMNDEGEAEVLVSKARLRGPSKVGMKFHGSSGRWEEESTETRTQRKLEGHQKTVRDALSRLNTADVYPSKSALQREAGFSSNKIFWWVLESLEGEVELISRHPTRHTKLTHPGLFLHLPPTAGGR